MKRSVGSTGPSTRAQEERDELEKRILGNMDTLEATYLKEDTDKHHILSKPSIVAPLTCFTCYLWSLEDHLFRNG